MYYNGRRRTHRSLKSPWEGSMRSRFLAIALFVAIPAAAQIAVQPTQRRPVLPQSTDEFLTNRPSTTPTSLGGEEYKIGRDDLLDVSVFDAPDLASSGRVS